MLTYCSLSPALQTLDSEIASSPSTSPFSRLKRKRRAGEATETAATSSPSSSLPPSSSSLVKGKMRAVEDRASTGSPAPTTLPWFAEDLSPEDLALVRNLNIQQGSSEENGGVAQWNGWDAQRGNAEQEERKKQIILGGHWGGAESASKREPGTYIAIDCEMVGVGVKGSESVLARVSIVNWHGFTLLDRFVKPQEKVTDYRTFVSGIRAKDLKDAPTFDVVQREVAELIKDRVLVGHAIQNDLKALLLDHPRRMIRDTATFQPLRDLAQTKHPALRKLALIVLGIDVQKKGQEHSSVEDARTTMAVFRTQKEAWEKTLREDQAKMNRRHAKKAARLGVDAGGDNGAAAAKVAQAARGSAAGGEASRPPPPPPKRKTNQATPNWWAAEDW